MSNPQLENGYIQIAREIWEHLRCFRIPGEVRLIVDTVIGQTYGWHKKSDKISNSQFCQFTGLKKQSVHRALLAAKDHKLVSVSADRLSFNKNYEEWIPFVKVSVSADAVSVKADGVLSAKASTAVSVSADKSSAEALTTKDNKETTKKNKGDSDSRIPFILKLIALVQGYQWANYPQESSGVKKCLKLGYTPEEIGECWRWLKAQPFWQEKPVSMQVVAKNIGEFRIKGNNHHGIPRVAKFYSPDSFDLEEQERLSLMEGDN